MKSKCKPATEQTEIDLAQRFGPYHCVILPEMTEQFKETIPDCSYRVQILHGLACAMTDDSFYVVASLRKIIRMVHVRVNRLLRLTYLNLLWEVGENDLSWVVDGVVPEVAMITPGMHAVDQHSMQFTMDLWKAMVAMIEQWRRPLPAGKHLLPELVVEWNRGKGPIDLYSRFQRNVKSQHAHLGPVAAIWLRLLMTMVYNS
jgi:hypothetical protein